MDRLSVIFKRCVTGFDGFLKDLIFLWLKSDAIIEDQSRFYYLCAF